MCNCSRLEPLCATYYLCVNVVQVYKGVSYSHPEQQLSKYSEPDCLAFLRGHPCDLTLTLVVQKGPSPAYKEAIKSLKLFA